MIDKISPKAFKKIAEKILLLWNLSGNFENDSYFLRVCLSVRLLGNNSISPLKTKRICFM
jgi:hypothetical protein